MSILKPWTQIKAIGKSPMIVEITEAKTVAWCGCRESKNKPFCDGSHKAL